MISGKIKYYLLAALSGLLFGMAFQPIGLWIFGFIFIIPLLFALEDTFLSNNADKKPAGQHRILYVAFFVQHFVTLWWIGSWQSNADPFLMAAGIVICIFRPFLYFIPFEGYLYIRRKKGLNAAITALPFLWTGFEWLLSVSEWAFPWISLGYTQVNNRYFNQIADLGGVLLISFVLISINAVLFRILMKYFNNPERHIRNKISIKSFKTEISLLLFLLLFPVIYSGIKYNRYSDSNIDKSKSLNIAIIQPNINPWSKWERNPLQNIKDHLQIQDSINKIFPGKTDLSLWSETSVTFLDSATNSYPYNVDFLHIATVMGKFSVLTGFTELYFYRDKENVPSSAKIYPADSSLHYQYFNSAIAVSPLRNEIQIYRKMKLTPVSERIPYIDQLPFMQNMLHWDVGISNWGLGKVQKTLKIEGRNGEFSIAPIICIESIHGDFVRKFASAGATIFTIITNDAWYSHTAGPRQHFAIAQMRAIENRRYIARCGNGGISGLIDPNGEILTTLPIDTYAGKIVTVPKITDLSFYTLHGDFAGYLSAIIAILILVATKIKKSH